MTHIDTVDYVKEDILVDISTVKVRAKPSLSVVCER